MQSAERFEHITVILQGPMPKPDSGDPELSEVTASIRTHLPGAKIILSTWAGAEHVAVDADQTLYLPDPGPLPPLKKNSPGLNNVNRQLRSTGEALRQVKSTHAVKMRTDCLLTGHSFVAMPEQFPVRDPNYVVFDERVVTSSFVTIDPRVLEQLPYHVSDWFQFGRTEDLLRLWSGPFMTVADATYFSNRPHRSDSRPRDRVFLSRFAAEQWVFLNALKGKIEVEVDFANDIRAGTLVQQDQIYANNLIIADPPTLEFVLPRKAWINRSYLYALNCVSHDDWLRLYQRYAVARESRAPSFGLKTILGNALSRKLGRFLLEKISRS